MFKRLLSAFIFLTLPSAVSAENAMCPDRPFADRSNACANTRFAKGALSFTGVTSQWPWQLNSDGSWTLKQPQIADLSDGAVIGRQAASIAALRALTPVAGQTIVVDSYYGDGNGGGGIFYAVTGASGLIDNGGDVILPTGGDGTKAWERQKTGIYPVKDWGAKCDASTDDTAAIQAAATAATAFSPFTGGTWSFIRARVYFPPSPGCKSSSTITVSSQVDVVMDSPLIVAGSASANLVGIHFTDPLTTAYLAPRWSRHKLWVYRQTQSDWSQSDGADVGALFDSEYMSDFDVQFIAGFRQAIAGSFGYGRIRIRELHDYQYGMTISSTGYSGALQNFTNEMVITAGEFASSANPTLPRYGIRFLSTLYYGANAIRIENPSFEQGANDNVSGVFIATPQTPVSAGNLTLAHTTLDVARRVKITTAANDSARTFTVTGTDKFGAPLTEAVTSISSGSNQLTVGYFSTVASVAVDAATAGNISVGYVQDAIPIIVDARAGPPISDITVTDVRREDGSEMMIRTLGDVRRVSVKSMDITYTVQQNYVDDQTTRPGGASVIRRGGPRDSNWRQIFSTGPMRSRLIGASGGHFTVRGMEFAVNAGAYVNYSTPQALSLNSNYATVGTDNVITASSTLIGATVYFGKSNAISLKGIKRPADDVVIGALVFDSSGNQLSPTGANNPNGVACNIFFSTASTGSVTFNPGVYRGLYTGGNGFTNNGATEWEVGVSFSCPGADHAFVSVIPAIQWEMLAQDEAYVKTLTSKYADQFVLDVTPAPITNVTYESGTHVLNFSPVEAGSAGSKYIVKGWSTSDGTTWLQNRVLTGN